MAFIRGTGTHRRTRPRSRRAKAAGIAGLTVGVVGSLATPTLAGAAQQPQPQPQPQPQSQSASGAAETTAGSAARTTAAETAAAEETAAETSAARRAFVRQTAAGRYVAAPPGERGPEAAAATGLSRAAGFGDVIADTVGDQARLQEAAAAQAKAANEARRKAAAEKAKHEREAERKAARAAERARLNAYVAPLADAHTTTPYQSSSGLWSSGSHTGVDFEAGEGTEVRAVASGEVVEAGLDGSFGNNVVIKHRDGTYTQYGHLSSIAVSTGQSVDAGQKIALSGSTGNTTGPHLHFEARTGPDYGSDMDPVAYLRKHGVSL